MTTVAIIVRHEHVPHAQFYSVHRLALPCHNALVRILLCIDWYAAVCLGRLSRSIQD